MSEFAPLIKSHPSARVRQLLASAELDRPTAGGRQRTLEAVSAAAHRPATTNFSGIALGTTVHRLIGAVTLYESKGGALRWVAHGGAVGVAVGALLLGTVVAWRWLEADQEAMRAHVVAHKRERAETGLSATETLRRAELEFGAGRAEVALGLVNEVLEHPHASEERQRAIVLQVKGLVALGRIPEAIHAARPLLNGSSAEADDVRSVLSNVNAGASSSAGQMP